LAAPTLDVEAASAANERMSSRTASAARRPVHLRSASATDPGSRRGGNEDVLVDDPGLGLFLVCDGMGGPGAGALAARTAAGTLQRWVSERLPAELEQASRVSRQRQLSLLRDGVRQASLDVFGVARSGQGRPGMGTTLTSLLVVGTSGLMAHVGDSRLYLCRGGQLHLLTDDHTYAAELERRGQITAEESEHSRYAHALTRAVGLSESVQVDTLQFDLFDGDVLLLCTDGLTGAMKADELLATLESAPPAEAADRLVRRAAERQSPDNITALVLRVDLQDHVEPSERTQLTDLQRSLEALRYVSVFQYLSLKELVKVMECFSLETVDKGQAIVREGDAGQQFFVLLEGTLQVTKGGVELRRLQAGSHFGEMALLDDRPRSASVQALEPVRILRMEQSSFLELMRQDDVLASKLLWTLAQVLSLRLDDASEHLTQAMARPRRPFWQG
jgi:serine/threonine protein phosphatase PrpC